MLDYGYRSQCCYAPIRIGRKKIKNSHLTKQVWVCVRCRKSDVSIIEYTPGMTVASTPKNKVRPKFASDDEVEISSPDLYVEES